MDRAAPASVPGLLAAWRLDPGRPPTPLDPGACAAALAAGPAPLWLHLDLVDQRTRALIAALPLPPAAARALSEPDDGPHLELAGGALFGVLQDTVYAAADGEEAATGLLHLALTETLLVTARRRPLRVVHEISRAPPEGGPAAAAAALLRGIAAATGREAQALDARLARLEDAMLKGGAGQRERQALAGLRRAALRLDRGFAPVAEALGAWAETADDLPAHGFVPAILGEQRRAAAVRRALLALQEHARIAQDELAGMATEETNRRLFVLSVISAAMLPASLVAGIFGMNVGALPGVEQEWGFAMAMGLILGSIAAILGLLRLWRML